MGLGGSAADRSLIKSLNPGDADTPDPHGWDAFASRVRGYESGKREIRKKQVSIPTLLLSVFNNPPLGFQILFLRSRFYII